MENFSIRDTLFDKAVALLSFQPYDTATVAQIATAAGVEENEFLKHFSGKEALLDEIYDYYEAHYFMTVRPLDGIQDTLKTGTAEEIIASIAWNFYGMPERIHRSMTSIARIVYSRFLVDDRANDIFANNMTKTTIEDIYIKLEALDGYGRLLDGIDLLGFAEMTGNGTSGSCIVPSPNALSGRIFII